MLIVRLTCNKLKIVFISHHISTMFPHARKLPFLFRQKRRSINNKIGLQQIQPVTNISFPKQRVDDVMRYCIQKQSDVEGKRLDWYHTHMRKLLDLVSVMLTYSSNFFIHPREGKFAIFYNMSYVNNRVREYTFFYKND